MKIVAFVLLVECQVMRLLRYDFFGESLGICRLIIIVIIRSASLKILEEVVLQPYQLISLVDDLLLILFHIFQTLIKKTLMTYQPFYYPYSVPHPSVHPVTLPLRQRLQELQREEDYRNFIETENAIRQDAEARQHYTRSLLINEKIENDLYRTFHEQEKERRMAEVAQTAIEYNYLRKIEELRKERELLDRSGSLQGYSPLKLNPFSQQERNVSDQQLIRLYESGSRGEEYRQELLAKMGRGHSDRIQRRESRNKQENFKKVYKHDLSNTKYETIAKQRSEEELAKRSYINDIDNSPNHKTSDSAFKRSAQDFNKGQTIDVFARTSDDSPFKHAYVRPKNKKSQKNLNKTINRSAAKEQKSHYYSYVKDQPSTHVTDSAMKKINNRLKVSEIVYKDSKLRHKRHEIDHLLNTFENELKGRKVVKDKINNHPNILKKHLLVTASR